jgi:5-methylcytosine-specific restriction enzyme A
VDVRAQVVLATVADHITPHRGDPELFKGPLQSLCASCHSSWKQELELTGHFRGCDLKGMPLDPSHHWNRG